MIPLPVLKRFCIALLFAGQISGCATLSDAYFNIRFVDVNNGRGIPLVEIETTHGVRFVSDSAGYIAILPFSAGVQRQFFYVRSHGYLLENTPPKAEGLVIEISAGGERQIPMIRKNIAERLYRITGEGIYNHAHTLGIPAFAGYSNKPRGGVYGQDSVVNAIFDGQLYWFWGDTLSGQQPLGNFKVSGATSRLPGHGGRNPDSGVDLSYFTDDSGFVRPMCPIKGNGAVWISGVTALPGQDNAQHLVCHYTQISSEAKLLEQGIAMWNEQRQVFEKKLELPLDSYRHPHGHTIAREIDGENWLYYGNPHPDLRVKADLEALLDPSQYEVFSFLRDGAAWNHKAPPLLRTRSGELDWQWRKNAVLVDRAKWQHLLAKGLVTADEDRRRLIDASSGKRIALHSGHIAWNSHRQRWILIAVQSLGDSPFGEVWYAEAHSPMGPWSQAVKILTHENYSFYNVKQHPYFAQGNYLYFEGTYTKKFSGNTESTPRYEYNQIMYRLNLNNKRLPNIDQKSAAAHPDKE